MAKDKNLRLRFDSGMKERLDRLWKAKKAKQQTAIEAILIWFLEQDSLLQSMILGQIEPDEQLLRAAIERMNKTRRPIRKEQRKI